MYSKAEFFYKFYSMAVSEIEEYKLSSSVAEWLEISFERYVAWHKANDLRVYRESLTLEQMARAFDRHANGFI